MQCSFRPFSLHALSAPLNSGPLCLWLSLPAAVLQTLWILITDAAVTVFLTFRFRKAKSDLAISDLEALVSTALKLICSTDNLFVQVFINSNYLLTV